MHPIFLVIIPAVLVIVGMVLNSIGLSFEQPPSSSEQDPAKRLLAERETNRQFFDRQRSRAMKRQKRVGQFGWLVLIVFVGSSIWLYSVTVSSTALSNRISALQTMGTEEGKNLVLSVTLTDGNNAKYLIKLSEADKLTATAKESISKEKISSWELERLGTALSIGDNPLPPGVALKISH